MEKAVLVNGWGEIVCYLEETPSGFYKLPDNVAKEWLLSDGDYYTVKTIWLEV